MSTFDERWAASRARVQKWRGRPARFTPAEGDAVDCTAFVESQEVPVDMGGFQALQSAHVAVFLVAEIAARPQHGGTLEILAANGDVAETWTVCEDASLGDSDRTEWRVRVSAATP